jgi:prepilin signal peptidase PulO-like enzyme (type II secretory pathway)
MNDSSTRASSLATSHWNWWSTLWRSGLLTLGMTFALSTQLLFQFDLYENWRVADILLGWLDHFVDQLIVGVCIFVSVALAALVPAHTQLARKLLVVLAIALGALAGETGLLLLTPLPPGLSVASVLATRVARWLVIAGLVSMFFTFQRQGTQAASRAHETELQRMQIDRQLTEARLQSLRAQIEPHFLFNTLANVQQLYRTEPERGRKMLGNFVAYLRAALPQMRQDETTLQQEVDLARAYLDVLQVRMGRRLQTRFDVPPELGALAFPPLALSTLTENAIKHGLNPLPEGGSIGISAWIEADRLKVCVADTGAGFRHDSGRGAGLANLRARLTALYGDAGHLAFEANIPRGIRATIALPCKGTVGTEN